MALAASVPGTRVTNAGEIPDIPGGNSSSAVNCAHRCLNQPIVVTSVQLLGVIFHAPEQRNTATKDSGPTLWTLPLSARDPSLTLTQFCARLMCYSAEHTKH